MNTIVYSFLIITYLCGRIKGDLFEFNDKCQSTKNISEIPDSWKNGCYYERYNDCLRHIKFSISATLTCSNLEQNELDEVYKYIKNSKLDSIDNNFEDPANEDNTKQFDFNIIFRNSSIPVLHSLDPKHFEAQTFQLSNLGISQVVPGFFTGIANLTSISLDNNDMIEITDGAFSSLNKLEHLDVSMNSLQQLKKHTFTGLVSLTNLNLSKNNISKIDSDAFLYNKKLLKVDLSENHIQTVPCFSYENVSVNLAHNNISLINISCSIQDLNVRYNTISTISNLSRNIEAFDVSYNKLSNISSIFRNTKQLRVLKMSQNKLLDLPIGSFKSLKNLTYLDLSYNRLTKIEFGALNGLSHLEYLNVEGNRLSSLALYAFPLHNLTTFYFAKNFINDLDIDMFVAPLLKSVSIDGPGWQCDNLAKIVHQIKSRKITMKMGSSLDTRNVEGILCSDENKEIKDENAVVANNFGGDSTKSNLEGPKRTKNKEMSSNDIGYINLTLNIMQFTGLVIVVYIFLTLKKNIESKRNCEPTIQLV